MNYFWQIFKCCYNFCCNLLFCVLFVSLVKDIALILWYGFLDMSYNSYAKDITCNVYAIRQYYDKIFSRFKIYS